MATVTFSIYSHYDPKDRERLEKETGQANEEEEDTAEIWRKEAALMNSKKPQRPAPRFVPATIAYDAWDSSSAFVSSSKTQLEDIPGDGKARGLFEDLPRTKAITNSVQSMGKQPPPVLATPKPTPAMKSDKNNWFIMKAIQSDTGSRSTPVTPAPSLADHLQREPPPLPSEARVKPPIWTSIGPSNKGFSMLQRGGWKEGETLGPYASRSKPSELILPDALRLQPRPRSLPSFGKGKAEVKIEDFGDDITEVKHVDIVDLTLTSESESEGEMELEQVEGLGNAPEEEDPSGHGGCALLAPIATVLKADRLGIGLKPKTIAGPSGAYRIPQKRVTHNAAAMAAHIREGVKLRQQKREQGRGHRAFARKKKREAAERKSMLAYMNT